MAHARRILALDPDALRAVFLDRPNNPYTSIMPLVWGSYGPLTQVRKTFPDIPQLAQDIARRGILNPQTVFAFSPDVAARYIAAVNLMWGATHTLADLPCCTLRDEPVYFILIAGERRFRALKLLWDEGCEECRATHGSEDPGTCFSRHFPHGLVPVNLKVGFTPYEALTDQFAENTHHRPRSDEEAIGFRVFYELMRVRESALTVTEFARRIGHNADRVRAALRYTMLPEFIQAAVAEGRIPYSSALALEQYHRERKDDGELQFWLAKAIAELEMSARRLEEALREDLKQWRASQRGLFGALAMGALERSHIRAVFDRNIARGLDRIEGFLYAVIHAQSSGQIGAADSPFATGAVVNAVLRIYRLLGMVVPIIRRDMTRRERREADELDDRLREDVEWLQERADTDTTIT